MKKVVFLHVQKSAGTSFENSLRSGLGDDKVYWHLNAKDNKKNPVNCYVIGGHKNYLYYQDGGPLDLSGFDVTYAAVVREPFERVVSLYNFHVNKNRKPFFDADGFDFDSIENTVFNCKKFRNMVRGGQCKIMSGKPSFESFINVVDNDSFIVGSMSSLSDFTDKLGEVIGCKIELGYHNLGVKGYERRLGLSDSVLSEIGSLVEEDIKLYDYIVNECNGLFVSGLA